MSKIIIDIDSSLQTKSFEKESIIHKKAFDKVIDLIQKRLEYIKTKARENQIKFDRYHETIMINGTRGAGKTSFLLSIIEEIRNKNNEIEVLKIIDPTLITTKQHVLLLIITLINEIVTNKQKNSFFRDFKPNDNRDRYRDEYNSYLKVLRKLARGINHIDNIGHNPLDSDLWEDETLVLEKGLHLAEAGLNFEQNFHEFIEKSLEVLNKEAFMIVFDDIDIDFSKGWEVLETIRKYLTSPRLIILTAGDIRIYDILIKEKKWIHFQKIREFENNKDQIYREYVEELSQQYSLKIIKPTNLVNLHNLYFYLISQESDIYVKIPNGSERKIKINDFIKCILEKTYSYFCEDYIYTITKLPFRTVSNFLQTYKYFNFINSQEESVQKNSQEESVQRKEAINHINSVFLTYLFKFNIGADFFELIITENGVENLAKKMLELNIYLEDIGNFVPNKDDNSKNIMFMLIPQYYNAYTPLYKHIDWALKFILPMYLYKVDNNKNKEETKSPNKNKEKTKDPKENEEEIKSFKENKEKIENFLRTFSYWHTKREILYKIMIEREILYRAYRKAKKSTGKDTQSKNTETIPGLIKKLNLIKNLKKERDAFTLFLGTFPIVDVIINEKKEIHSVVSIFEILKLMYMLLDIQNSETELKEYIKYTLKKYYDSDTEDEEEIDLKVDKVYDELKFISEEWLKGFENIKKIYNMHILEFHEIFIEFLNRIEKIRVDKVKNITGYISLLLAAFLQEYIKVKTPNEIRKGVYSDYKVFINTLKKIKEEKNKNDTYEKIYNFIEFIIKCPVLTAYLDERLRNLITEIGIKIKIGKDEKMEELYKTLNGVYEALNKVNLITESRSDEEDKGNNK